MLSENPYAPPQANVERVDAPFEASPDVLKKIRNAAIAAAISAGLTLIVTLIAISGTVETGFDASALVDVALAALLAYGIYRKSRTCAVIMLVYFIGAKIFIFYTTGRPNGIILAVVFLYYFVLGVQGTFAYHSQRKAHVPAA